MVKPIISIVIPTKNRVECVNSLTSDLVSLHGFNRNQFEIVVLDNATPAAKYLLPLEVSLYKHPNDIGAIKNIISAVHFAQGEYVWILGDDDSLRMDTFDVLLCLINQYSPSLIRLRHEYVETNEVLSSFPCNAFPSNGDGVKNISFTFRDYGLSTIRLFEDKAGFITSNIFRKNVLVDSLRICRDITTLHVYENNVYMTKLYTAVALYLCGGYWESNDILVKQRIPLTGRNFVDTGNIWFRNFLEAPAEVYTACSALSKDLSNQLLKLHYGKVIDFKYAANNNVSLLRCLAYVLQAATIAGLKDTLSSLFRCLSAYLRW